MRHLLRKLAKAARLSGVPLYRRALLKGVGAAIEHEDTLALLKRSGNGIGVIIDIGANVGQFSLVARRCFPAATILAFEPLSAAADRFQAIFQRDSGVRLFQAAVGDRCADLEMHVSQAADSSSLLPIGRGQWELFPGTEESHLERVKVAPLDHFFSAEDLGGGVLLKIDTQGYELSVLKGCASLMDSVVAVYVECSFIELYQGQALVHEVVDWLQGCGFYLAQIGTLYFDRRGVSIQGDFLFLRSNREINSFRERASGFPSA